MKKNALIIVAVFLTFGLSGCEKTKEQFDFSRKPPDEFAVTKRAPLEMPPDYSLRPPRPGALRPQEQSPDQQAREAVFGANAADNATPAGGAASLTEGEAILLQKTGAYQPNPDIREIVDEETQILTAEEKPTIDRILSVTGKKYEAPAKIVDSKAEAERLKKNAEEGKSVTEGETPVIED